MPRLAWKRGLLAKIEAAYGTDSAPAGATDAIEILGEVEVQSIDLETEEPDVAAVVMGHDPLVMSGAQFKQIRFGCQLQSSGTAGTAPAIKSLLRACSMTETVTALQDAVYDPNSAAADSLTIKYNEDGENHAIVGARGTWELTFEAKKRPRIMFTFVGLYVAVADLAMPTPLTLTAFKKALPVNNVNTTPFTVHGFAAKMYSFSLALNNQFAKRHLVGVHEVLIVNRAPAGSLTIEKPTIATFNYMDKVVTAAVDALALTHGTAAGLKVKVDVPKLQLLPEPKFGNVDGVATVALDVRATRNAGNDEVKLTFL